MRFLKSPIRSIMGAENLDPGSGLLPTVGCDLQTTSTSKYCSVEVTSQTVYRYTLKTETSIYLYYFICPMSPWHCRPSYVSPSLLEYRIGGKRLECCRKDFKAVEETLKEHSDTRSASLIALAWAKRLYIAVLGTDKRLILACRCNLYSVFMFVV